MTLIPMVLTMWTLMPFLTMIPVGISGYACVSHVWWLLLANSGCGSLPMYVTWVVPLQLEAGGGFGYCVSTCLACVMVYIRCLMMSWTFTIGVVSLSCCFSINIWPGARCSFSVMIIYWYASLCLVVLPFTVVCRNMMYWDRMYRLLGSLASSLT